jgi:hypothetical protein
MLLRKDDPWPRGLPVPDIRGWRVLDARGQPIGFVQSLAVDPKDLIVEAILTGANDRFPGADIEIEEAVVRVNQRMERRSEGGPCQDFNAFRGFEAAYRDHYEHVYAPPEGGQELTYDAVRPAYEFGREIALDADYQRRTFQSSEEDLKAEYVARGLSPCYDVSREAIRTGYKLAQTSA